MSYAVKISPESVEGDSGWHKVYMNELYIGEVTVSCGSSMIYSDVVPYINIYDNSKCKKLQSAAKELVKIFRYRLSELHKEINSDYDRFIKNKRSVKDE